MRAIISEEKKEVERVTLKGDTLRKYFPASYTRSAWRDYHNSCWNSGRSSKSGVVRLSAN